MLTRDEYAKWWDDNTDGDMEVLASLPEPVATLAAHVMALQERVDLLPSPDDHDRAHGHNCRCRASQCACAYGHPQAECMTHRGPGPRDGRTLAEIRLERPPWRLPVPKVTP
jgi:hypothetical protein